MVRFGRWDQVMAEPDPGPDSSFVKAMWHYARGTARAAKGDTNAAEAELQRLRSLAKAPELATLKIFDTNSLDKLAAIAEALLGGQIAAARKDAAGALRSLKRAVDLEDSLLYSEPPDWPLPPRHVLGAVLLDFGRAKEAEQCFREDLKRHRNNGWALRGLARSLEAQGRKSEAAAVTAQFQKAWAKADVSIATSRL
jgi:tetratricopeptide (TPR) repeat protein